jgi:hypothetical protein
MATHKKKPTKVPAGTTLQAERIFNDDINLLFAVDKSTVLIEVQTKTGGINRISLPAEQWLLMNKRMFKVVEEEVKPVAEA